MELFKGRNLLEFAEQFKTASAFSNVDVHMII
ncbi:MAG: hypothetical protein ACI9P5_001846 [Saprospiraceae bacterium]|jgi:hypothetical protein